MTFYYNSTYSYNPNHLKQVEGTTYEPIIVPGLTHVLLNFPSIEQIEFIKVQELQSVIIKT